MPPEKTQKLIIQETHDAVVRLETTMPFVMGEIKEIKTNVNNLGKSHGRLKRNFWLLVGVLAGSGIIGGGVWGLLGG